jgi:hypothetical protein
MYLWTFSARRIVLIHRNPGAQGRRDVILSCAKEASDDTCRTNRTEPYLKSKVFTDNVSMVSSCPEDRINTSAILERKGEEL